MKLVGQRIVITGATGFIGSHVACELARQGAQVYALVRPDSPKKKMFGEISGICTLEYSMEQVLGCVEEIHHADLFLHFAWGGVNREEIDSPSVQERNVIASLDCVRVAHALGCKVFMDAGSRVEYGITDGGRMEESMECHPVNEYGKAKLRFYQDARPLCKQWNMTYYHLRFFSVYGVGDHPWSIISTLVEHLPKGEIVSLSACKHQWNFMEINDAANAVCSLCKNGIGAEGEAYIVNIASFDTRELKSFVEEVHSICKGQGGLDYGAFVQGKEGALSICPITEVLPRLTNGTWKEGVSFGDGIRRMLGYKEEK